MKRVLVPSRLRSAVRSWFDSRYISITDHRQDIRDALWEVQTLRREMATLQGEVERLRSSGPPVKGGVDKATFDQTRKPRPGDRQGARRAAAQRGAPLAGGRRPQVPAAGARERGAAVRVSWAAGRLTFRLDPEDEITGRAADGHPVKLATNSCIGCPDVPDDAHPDLFAVAAWTVVAPWTRRRITFDRAVSAGAGRGAARRAGGSRPGPSGASRARPGGGWRSPTAAAPTPWRRPRCYPEAPFVHFQRVSHPTACRTAGSTTAPTCWPTLASKTGRELTVVPSDLEFTLAEPRPGYPEHHAVAAGALLLADRARPRRPGLRLRARLALAGRRPLPAALHPRQPDVGAARRVGPGCSPRRACTSCSRWAA